MARRTSATRATTAKRLPPKTVVPNPDAETITDPQALEETDAPTTADPDGNESVVEINGEATEPNADGSDGASFGTQDIEAAPAGVGTQVTTTDASPLDTAANSGPVDTTTTVPADDPAPEVPEFDPNQPALPGFIDPNPNDNLTDETILSSPYRTYWQEQLDRSGITPPVGRLLFPGEPLTFVGERSSEGVIVLTEDIYRVVFPFRSLRPTFTLEHRAGKRIPKVRTVTKAEYLKQTRRLIEG